MAARGPARRSLDSCIDMRFVSSVDSSNLNSRMAFITKRGPAQWRAQVRKKGFPGYSRTFVREDDAVGWATELEAAIGRRNLAEVRRLTDKGDGDLRTVGDLVDKFLVDVVEQPGRRVNQVASEKPRLARIRLALGKQPLEMLSAVAVSSWKAKRLKGGAAPQTVVHDLNQLSRLLGYAADEWGVAGAEEAQALVRKVAKPPLPSGRSRRVAQAEIDFLLREADRVPPGGGRPAGRGMKAIIILAAETSMRLSELIGLHWAEIDLVARTAHLRKTKNGESRTVALTSVAVTALKTMEGLRDDGRVFDWNRSDSFVNRFIGLVRRARVRYLAACKEEHTKPDPRCLTDLRFHDLRHEATSRLFEKGLNIMEVASMTGHKSIQMLKRYTHVDAAKVAAKLG